MTTEVTRSRATHRVLLARELDWDGEPRRVRQIRRLRALAAALDERLGEAMRIRAELFASEAFCWLGKTVDRRRERIYQIRTLLLELER